MIAVFKREFKALFTSPIAYFVWALLFFFAGLYFYSYNILGGQTDLSGVFGILHTISLLLVVPILTMRSFASVFVIFSFFISLNFLLKNFFLSYACSLMPLSPRFISVFIKFFIFLGRFSPRKVGRCRLFH